MRHWRVLRDLDNVKDFRRDLRLLEHAPDALLVNGLDHLLGFRLDLWHWHIHDVLRVFLLVGQEVPQICPPTCTLATASVHVGAERSPAHRAESTLFHDDGDDDDETHIKPDWSQK